MEPSGSVAASARQSASAVASSSAVENYCIEHFGRGLEVVARAYAETIPDENAAPFL